MKPYLRVSVFAFTVVSVVMQLGSMQQNTKYKELRELTQCGLLNRFEIGGRDYCYNAKRDTMLMIPDTVAVQSVQNMARVAGNMALIMLQIAILHLFFLFGYMHAEYDLTKTLQHP